MSYLKITYPELPPTSNKIYFRGTSLTTIARSYAEKFSQFAIQNHGHEVMNLNKDGIYWLHLAFYFPSLINESFNNPDVPEQRRAKTRYKRIDLTNRIKLLEDCVRDFLDIDDCQTFCASQEKFHSPNFEGVVIEVREVNPRTFNLPVGG